jgi:hypothetical protein
VPNPLYFIINPVLIIIGWAVVVLLARRTARRNESRGMIDRTISIVDRLEEYGCAAWGGRYDHDSSPITIVTSIAARIDLLEEYLSLLETRRIGKYSDDWISEFRDTMTLDLESKNALNEIQKAKKLNLISRECRRITVQLEKDFQNLYS